MRYVLDVASGWSTEAILIRLLFSLVVGVLIGIDRGLKRRGAGIKTHALVCVGSALVMLTSEYISIQFPDIKADMARMGAQVISGVGFLGVGTIMVTGKNQVRGLTTAAGLWACACVGLAAGIGFLEGATYALILIVITLKLLTKIDVLIHNHATIFDFYLEFNSNRSIASFVDSLRQMDLRIVTFDISKGKIKGEGPSAVLTVEIHNKKLREDLLNQIRTMECVRFVEEL